MTETWISRTPTGVVVARSAASGGLSVDFPTQRRFRVAYPPPLHNGPPAVDGVVLSPATGMPSTMEALAGWYEFDSRRLLLTQFPEPYFGEPMVLVAADDQVMRAYPVAGDRLIGDDGSLIECLDGRLRVHRDGAAIELLRSPRFREEPVMFRAGDAVLSGTVIVPTAPGPHAAAVVVHGAAGGQRDFCRLQAETLLDAGVAVLIYDKPGHGRSSGAADPSTFDQADAVQAGLAVLASRADVDPARIGLAGFSNGMWSVPMVAARQPVAFIVGIGSPGVSMGEAEVHRRTKVLHDCGVGEATIAAVAQAWRAIFAIVGAGAAEPTMAEQLETALARIAAAVDLDRYEVPDYVRQNPMLSSVPPAMPIAELVGMLVANADPQVAYDPAVDYARITCPIFLQYGTEDTSVPVTASTAAIAGATRGRATISVYPGLEHMLNIVRALDGLSLEESMYQFHSFQFGPDVRADLINWLRDNVLS